MADSAPDLQVYNETSTSLPLEISTVQDVTASIAQEENCFFRLIEIVFVDEEEIIRINQQHLGRDYITDIITFRYDESDSNEAIEGTLFCCAPRISEQARELDEPQEREFLRIVIHGLLHLAGYEDQSETQKQQMTSRENHYLTLST